MIVIVITVNSICNMTVSALSLTSRVLDVIILAMSHSALRYTDRGKGRARER